MFTIQLKLGTKNVNKAVITTKDLRESLGIDFVSLKPAIIADIEKTITSAVKKNFATQGAYSGEQWAPLKPSTIRDRKRRGFKPGPPLVRSGELKRAATMPVFTSSPLKQRVTFNVNNAYASFQNNGTRNIPARPFFRLSEKDIEKIAGQIKKSLSRVK